MVVSFNVVVRRSVCLARSDCMEASTDNLAASSERLEASFARPERPNGDTHSLSCTVAVEVLGGVIVMQVVAGFLTRSRGPSCRETSAIGKQVVLGFE